MKNIVIFDEYNEIDLKPSDLLDRYVALTKEDIAHLLIEGKKLKSCPCPACQSTAVASHFNKFDLQYQECRRCHSLYISPRPDDVTLNRYYRAAKSRIFWREELSKATQKKRKEKIIKPRFQWISESTREYLPRAVRFVDINTNQLSYAEEIVLSGLFERNTLIDPFFKLDDPLNLTVEVMPTPWWEASFNGEADAVSIFEVADHTADVDLLFGKIKKMLKKNGLCFMTAILSSGFDLQVLWEKAENLYPPDRLNVFSVEGLKALFERHGFECLELSTPGILDVEIVLKAARDNPSLKLPKFVEYILHNRSEDIRKAFQEFLQSSLLSSYGRILLRKK